MDQLALLGKRELICLLLFAVIMWFLFGVVSSSSGCLRWATLFNCGTPLAFHIIILSCVYILRITDGFVCAASNMFQSLVDQLPQLAYCHYMLVVRNLILIGYSI